MKRVEVDNNWCQWMLGFAWDKDFVWIILGPITFCYIKV